jgi:predicted transcriptional regulator
LWQDARWDARGISRFGIFHSFEVASLVLKNIHSTEHERLCALLRELRVEAELTQADLADKLDVPQSFVSKYESGERRLDVLELRRVCKAIKMSLPEFVKRLEKVIG